MRNLHLDELRDHCLAKPSVTESFPFDQKTLVFKVAGKMFALCDVDDFQSINLKCNPDLAVELRSTYEAVLPGWHMNKRHWNTVAVEGDASRADLIKWVDDSYDLIVASLTRKVREEHGL